jgi:hypothetical protein
VSVASTDVLLCFETVALVTLESTASKQFIAAIMVVLKLAASMVSTRGIGAWCKISTTQVGKDQDNSAKQQRQRLWCRWQEIAQGCPIFLNATKVTLVAMDEDAVRCRTSHGLHHRNIDGTRAHVYGIQENRCLPRSTLRLSFARAGLHNVAILHEVFECFIVVKLGCTVEIFMLVRFEIVNGALVGPEREYKLLGVRSSVLVDVELVEQLVGRKEYHRTLLHMHFVADVWQVKVTIGAKDNNGRVDVTIIVIVIVEIRALGRRDGHSQHRAHAAKAEV